MRLASPIHAADRVAGRFRAALISPAKAEFTVLASLAIYAVLWTVYGAILEASLGLHPDMTEIIAWSRDLSLGYTKHPPLAAWIAGLWFSVFPVAGWSYSLLAMLMPVIALWIAWRLSADYLDIEKRVFGLALLTLIPFFNFHALKYNVNTVLMPVWAATTFWFLKSFKTRSAFYAVLAGVGAVACMLGKYWSVFLLAGLAVAALIDARRAIYFRSPAPWITVAVGVALIAPHLNWLAQNDFAPFGYAVIVHGAKPFAESVEGVIGYLAGSVGYVTIPVIIVLAAARPSLHTIADTLWPASAERRFAAAAFWAPFLLPVVGGLASGTSINSLWSMSTWTLLPVLLLSSPSVTLRAVDTRRILFGVVALPLIMLILSPAIAVMNRRDGPPPAAAQSHLLAVEVERLWRDWTPQPLRFVGGEGDVFLGVMAYAKDRPRALLAGLPEPGGAHLQRSGMALLCSTGDPACLNEAARWAGTAPRRATQTVISQKSWGRVLPQRSYTIIIVPPQS
jgi:4-amino-4-deoxy-L-arabinose transferase-like glycosyltransferase